MKEAKTILSENGISITTKTKKAQWDDENVLKVFLYLYKNNNRLNKIPLKTYIRYSDLYPKNKYNDNIKSNKAIDCFMYTILTKKNDITDSSLFNSLNLKTNTNKWYLIHKKSINQKRKHLVDVVGINIYKKIYASYIKTLHDSLKQLKGVFLNYDYK